MEKGNTSWIDQQKKKVEGRNKKSWKRVKVSKPKTNWPSKFVYCAKERGGGKLGALEKTATGNSEVKKRHKDLPHPITTKAQNPRPAREREQKEHRTTLEHRPSEKTNHHRRTNGDWKETREKQLSP